MSGDRSPEVADDFAFRPWVRSTCRRAMLWGVGVVAILGGIAWVLRTPASAPVGRAFGVLVAYGALFWATLLKVWWTAGKPAVVVADGRLAYQPLHTFKPRALPLDAVLSCAPKPGTQALRLVYRGQEGEEREFFLNLGVVDGRHALLDRLGEELAERGLEAVGSEGGWKRPDWRPW